MKNLFIAALIMLMGTTVESKASNGDDKVKNKEEKNAEVKSGGIGFGIEIDFGRHKLGCDGRGLCRAKVSITTDDSPFAKYSQDDGTITITVPIEYITRTQPQKLADFRGQTKFVVEEEFTFPRDISERLGCIRHFVVKVGSYPMTLRDGIYTITLGEN